MKSRFALALLASVAVIAAMTTDASAAGRGSGGGGGRGGGGGFHGGGGGGFHMGGGGGCAMGGGGMRMGGGGFHAQCFRGGFVGGGAPSFQAPRGQRARICGTQFWRRRISHRQCLTARQRVVPGRGFVGKMPACARSAIRTRTGF